MRLGSGIFNFWVFDFVLLTFLGIVPWTYSVFWVLPQWKWEGIPALVPPYRGYLAVSRYRVLHSPLGKYAGRVGKEQFLLWIYPTSMCHPEELFGCIRVSSTSFIVFLVILLCFLEQSREAWGIIMLLWSTKASQGFPGIVQSCATNCNRKGTDT